MSETITEIEKKSVFNILDYTDIKLYFPDSISSESLIKEFILSKNDVRQSDFLEVILDNMSNNDEYDNNRNIIISKNQIKIPSNLYRGIRYIDLVYFFDLWKGKEILTESSIGNDKIHNLKAIKRLCDSLMLNTELYFVKRLMNLFPNNNSG